MLDICEYAASKRVRGNFQNAILKSQYVEKKTQLLRKLGAKMPNLGFPHGHRIKYALYKNIHVFEWNDCVISFSFLENILKIPRILLFILFFFL